MKDGRTITKRPKETPMTLIDQLTRTLSSPTRAREKIGLRARLALWRSRRALARLDQAALDDIGIDAKAARAEARLGPWDVPSNWVKH